MTLSSMTGFARSSGHSGTLSWQWELRSVNNKGFDARLRLPPGFDQLEVPVRARIAGAFNRGSIQASLSASGLEAETLVTINDAVLEQVLSRAEALRKQLKGPPLQAEALLSLRGVVDIVPKPQDESLQAEHDVAILKSFDDCVIALRDMRREEGFRIATVLADNIAQIESLAVAARDSPARKPDAIRDRLREQVARLLETGATFDPDRLHQEALLLATKADIQEELDRLFSHIEAARGLLRSRDPVGRKLDFLSQEFNREANTLCSKANDKSVTAIGLDLKTTIDQLREQVQNIE